MSKTRFLYSVFASMLIFGFFHFQEFEQAKAGVVPSNYVDHQWLLHQWVVAEAKEVHTGKDVTAEHASEVWQFLMGNSFLLFNNQVLEQSGEWELLNGAIRIQSEGKDEKEVLKIEKKSRNELLLLSRDLRVRLLKLDDV